MSLKETPQIGSDALMARAVVIVTFGCAGLWYVLWKLALISVAGR